VQLVKNVGEKNQTMPWERLLHENANGGTLYFPIKKCKIVLVPSLDA
jgi:hypothetical protein